MQRPSGTSYSGLSTTWGPGGRIRGRARLYGHMAAFVGILGLTALILDGLGRSWLCSGAYPWQLWSGDLGSRHASQHLLDPYSATHVLHGLVFYAGVWLLVGSWLAGKARWWMALGAEAAWEVIENTPFVIERYREATLALGYYGDSIINSLGDIASFVVGYALALVLSFRAAVALFVLVEGVLVFTIRDSLILNVVMLLYPLEVLREWQMGG